MPWTHCATWPWFSHSMNSKPTFSATPAMAVSMFLVNGLALETGMLRIFLPAMHWRASNGSPAASNCGFSRNGSSWALK